MPNCIKFFDKNSFNVITFNEIDERICKEVYNCEPHPRFFGGEVFNWYDSIAFQLATSKDLEDSSEKSVRKFYQESPHWKEELPIIEKTIDFLQQNYVSKSWFEVFK